MSDVVLRYPDGEMPLEEVPATVGESGLNIGPLLKTTGRVTLDFGFTNTAACTSSITYIDGDAGILRYRGYPIEQLAQQSTFLETSYLLIYGELPSQDQLDEFKHQIRMHTMLHEDLRRFFDGFPRDAHPMPVLSSAVSALSTFYQDSLDPFDPRQVEISTIRLLAKVPTIAAYAHKKAVGQPYLYPDNTLGFIDNFLRMTFGVPAEDYVVNPILSKALNQLLLLHADHEQNCSTNAVRSVASSGNDLYTCCSAGIGALHGPLHGGANEAVLKMLREIGTVDRVPEFIEGVKAGKVRMMGFGHRVYKNYDPRAKIIKKSVEDVFEVTGVNPLLQIALELEKYGLTDEYFVKRRLYPNVDFYSGLIYEALGFPPEMFTVLFAIPRTSGWAAQYQEFITDPENKIARPKQIYTGNRGLTFTPAAQRWS